MDEMQIERRHTCPPHSSSSPSECLIQTTIQTSHSRPILPYSHLICILWLPPHEIIWGYTPGLMVWYMPSYTKSYRSWVMHHTAQTTNVLMNLTQVCHDCLREERQHLCIIIQTVLLHSQDGIKFAHNKFAHTRKHGRHLLTGSSLGLLFKS